MRRGVVVVGASAAGLEAARVALRGGAPVTLLERRNEVGVPEAPALLAFDALWPPSAGTLAPDDVRRRLAGIRVRSPGGRALDVTAPATVLDRTRFDRRLAEEVTRRGGEIRCGVGAVHVADDRRVHVDGDILHPSVLIFADGTGSQASRFLRPVRRPDALTWGVAQQLAFPGAGARDVADLTFGSHARGGRSQLTPLSDDAAMHWTFYRGEPEAAATVARRALAHDATLSDLPRGAVASARLVGVAPDPVYTLPGDLVADRVMVVGGAAGQGGLEMGLRAGGLAGEVAAAAASGPARRGDLLPYARAWRRAHAHGYRALRWQAEAMRRLQDDELDRLIGAWEGRRLDLADGLAVASRGGSFRAARLLASNPHALPGLVSTLLRASLRGPLPAGS